MVTTNQTLDSTLFILDALESRTQNKIIARPKQNNETDSYAHLFEL